MKRPKRIAFIGADGTGKTQIATRMASKDGSVLIRLSKYDSQHKFFRKVGGAFDRILAKGEQKKSKKLIILGYMGHAALQPFYRIRKEKGKERVYYARYAPYDIDALARVYGKGKATQVLKKVIKFTAASPKPDALVLMEANPGEALERIRLRGSRAQMHENEKDIRNMAESYSETAEKARKEGVRLVRVFIKKK